jgi:hypothetical protein
MHFRSHHLFKRILGGEHFLVDGRGLALFLIAQMLATVAVCAEGTTKLREPVAIGVGQTWTIKSVSRTTTVVTIGRIEPWNGKVVTHISAVNVPIPFGVRGSGGITRINHMPFEKSALEASLDRLLATDALLPPDFESGYAAWRSDKGAGIYTIGVSEAIDRLFSALPRERE